MRTVVITGGNKGLGLAQTSRFLEAGWTVHVVSRTEGDLGTLAPGPGRLEWQRCDLGDGSDTDYLDQVCSREGGISALVNNAGAHLKKPVWEVSPAEFQRVLDINIKSMFAACGHFVRLQGRESDNGEAENCGAIVNISSMGGLMALPSAAAYVTAKTGVIGLTRSVAVDGAIRGIRCNAVCPGFIDTDMTRAILEKDPARRERIERRIPSRRFGLPDDVANAVYFLASDESRYVNGAILPVDGGYAVGF